MKVVCIANGTLTKVPYKDKDKFTEDMTLPEIPIGTECTVIDQAEYLGKHFYRFAEYVKENDACRWWYESTLFKTIEPLQLQETLETQNIIL